MGCAEPPEALQQSTNKTVKGFDVRCTAAVGIKFIQIY